MKTIVKQIRFHKRRRKSIQFTIGVSIAIKTFYGQHAIKASVQWNHKTSGKHVREMYTPVNPTFIQKKGRGVAGVYLIFLF